MRYRTHLAFSILIFLLYYNINHMSSVSKSLAVLILMILFSSLPDIDLHTSWLGKKIKPLSYIFEVVLKHRGFMHSLWLPIIGYYLLPSHLEVAVLGYVSHISLDILTTKGLKLFWPFFKVEGYFRTGGLVDNLLFYLTSSLDVFLVAAVII